MTEAEFTARTLAAALLAVEWSLPSLQAQTARVLGIPKEPIYSTQIKLIEELFAETPINYPPSPEWIVRRLLENSDFHDSVNAPQRNTASVSPALSSPLFAPTPRFAGLDIPRLATPGELAAWAGLTIAELDWFTDARRQQGNTDIPILQHYTYAFIAKRTGPPRLVEQPKPRLKAIQRRILRDILDKVPAHPAAHGFVTGRSCLTGAAAHAGEAVVATADLRDFFLTTPLKRVHGVFRSLGFPWAVARALTSLCATATPASVFLRLAAAQRHDHATRRMFRSQHLPQGAPTSPALANLAAWGLDQRLAGLAGRLDATYTRYADDLAFSGGDRLADRIDRVLPLVREIAEDEDYALNPAKTRVMRSDDRQIVTGLVVNAHLNVSRASYDRLKATLHNCVANGPDAENRDGLADFRAHLDGRVGWVEQVNPERGAKLRQIFDRIKW